MKTSAFLIRVAICFLLSLIPLGELENRIYSLRMELRHSRQPPSDLILVTTEADGLGQTLERILSSEAKLVLVTWTIPADSARVLAEKARVRDPRILWSAQFDSEGKFMGPSKPLTASRAGFNNLMIDSDGVVRAGLLSRDGHPSLTGITRDLVMEAAASRDPSEPFLINYAGPAGTLKQCRIGEPACSDLKGKIVFLAPDSERPQVDSLGEPIISARFRTPLGEMSRAEIIANEVNTQINRLSIYRAGFIERSLITLALIFAGAFYIIYYPVVLSAIATSGTGAIVVIFLFQLIFQLFDIYIPSVNIAASLLITYLVFTGYRLAVQENLQWRSVKQAQYLRELDQMKSNFLSLVSHDLKTPLAKIQAVVERLRREQQLPEKERSDWRDPLDSIENSNNELKHYITSILNLSKIESQKVILKKKSNDINRIIQQTLKRLRSTAQAKELIIEESLEPLFSVECDEDLIRQVLTNLVDNAIKYSPTGSRVLIRSFEEEGFIRVEVEDFGPGIPKDQLPMMFRKFSRFLRPVREQVKGTGLGLYLSKYFIELHGGTIRVKSVEGKGTTFSFTLPLSGEAEAILG